MLSSVRRALTRRLRPVPHRPWASWTGGRCTMDWWWDRWTLGWWDKEGYWHRLVCVCWRPRRVRDVVALNVPWSRRRW